MAKDKEKTANPVAAHHKQTKRAAVKKSKAAVQQAREERLSKRNPARLEKQIGELKELEAAGRLRPKDKENLRLLERDLAAVRRARERSGGGGATAAAGTGPEDAREQQRERRGRRDNAAAGKENGGKGMGDSMDGGESSETDDDVRAIPMPRDTPPPIPRRRGGRAGHAKQGTAAAPAQVTYSSAPVLRDLRAEATAARFAPAAVRRNIDRVKGKGGLVGEDEYDRLEKAGYATAAIPNADAAAAAVDPSAPGGGEASETRPAAATVEDVEDEDL